MQSAELGGFRGVRPFFEGVAEAANCLAQADGEVNDGLEALRIHG